MKVAYTLKEIAAILKSSQGKIIKLAKASHLGRKIGLMWLFNENDIQRLDQIILDGKEG